MTITKDIRYVGVNDHQVDLVEGQYETHSNHSLVNKIITNDEHRGNNL